MYRTLLLIFIVVIFTACSSTNSNLKTANKTYDMLNYMSSKQFLDDGDKFIQEFTGKFYNSKEKELLDINRYEIKVKTSQNSFSIYEKYDIQNLQEPSSLLANVFIYDDYIDYYYVDSKDNEKYQRNIKNIGQKVSFYDGITCFYSGHLNSINASAEINKKLPKNLKLKENKISFDDIIRLDCKGIDSSFNKIDLVVFYAKGKDIVTHVLNLKNDKEKRDDYFYEYLVSSIKN